MGSSAAGPTGPNPLISRAAFPAGSSFRLLGLQACGPASHQQDPIFAPGARSASHAFYVDPHRGQASPSPVSNPWHRALDNASKHPILGSATPIISAESLLPCNTTYSQVPVDNVRGHSTYHDHSIQEVEQATLTPFAHL